SILLAAVFPDVEIAARVADIGPDVVAGAVLAEVASVSAPAGAAQTMKAEAAATAAAASFMEWIPPTGSRRIQELHSKLS
ncbi:MAG: hypothetical protein QOI01_5180, partial [Mycobacterium sp.]|nr:hypothetical protein [Mycobacterium sp.]